MRFLLFIPLFLCFSNSGISSESDSKIKGFIRDIESNPDSVLSELRLKITSEDDQLLLAAYYGLMANCFEATDQSDSAVHYFQKADRMYIIKAPGSDKRIQNLAVLADHYYQKGELTTSAQTYDKALLLCSQKTDYTVKADILLSSGWLLREQGQHALALDRYFEAIELAKINDDEGLMARSYSVIAIVYAVKQEHETALGYYNKALAIRKQEHDQSAIASLYNNIGLLYADQGNFKRAIHYYGRALNINDSIGNQKGVAIQNENLGLIYLEYFKDEDEALRKFDRSLNYWRLSDDIYGQSQTLIYKVYVFSKQGKNKMVIDSSLLALELSREAGARDVELDALKHLASAHENLGQNLSALIYYKSFITLRDSLDRVNDDAEIDRLELEMEYSAKQLQDSLNLAVLYEKEQAGILLDVESGKFWNKLLILGIIASFVIILLAVYVGRQRRKRVEAEHEVNVLLTQKNQEIIDSINYAKQIQSAILPSKDKLSAALGDHFIFYQPKDIVAGDFYWLEEVSEQSRKYTYFAVADCTGHGVPGAMVSVICSGALNKAVLEIGLREPGKILSKVTEIIIETLSKGGQELKDGMDIALCRFEAATNTLSFAGANNGIWVVSGRTELYAKTEEVDFEADGTFLYEIKASKQPVGRFHRRTAFETHELQIERGEQLYLFTDGYADQFGGEKNKKFKYRALKELILSGCELSLDDQGKHLKARLDAWMGEFEQVDDICILGMRF